MFRKAYITTRKALIQLKQRCLENLRNDVRRLLQYCYCSIQLLAAAELHFYNESSI
eukprot:UN08266